eukprot:TRINITY_DN12731_c0_g1_i2.p2 TRINITY_DN12731_c0_g1~~TRINITY_DN12731_c0_g1_i2.p2  ORF type:complete len:134 (-),score=28.02 TRINITY_DN12731_c0_g1_i2:668-1069(-)
MVVSVLKTVNTRWYTTVTNSKLGMSTYNLTVEVLEKYRGSLGEKLISYFEEKYSCFFRKIKCNDVTVESLMNDLCAVQEKHRLDASKLRLALLYCKEGQVDPRDEMFCNKTLSPECTKFFSLLGYVPDPTFQG